MKSLALIISVLFLAAILYVINMPPKDITIKDIAPSVYPNESQNDQSMEESNFNDSEGEKGNGTENSNEILLSDYYIIVESVSNLTLAQNKAKKLQNDFNTNFIVLPPTKEGYCRISCGQYSTLEEAQSAMKSIKAKISPSVWILKVKR